MKSLSKVLIRETPLEILRLVAALLIFLHHAIVHCGVPFDLGPNFASFCVEFFQRVGKIGVILYALISGYTLTKSKFTWTKFVTFFLEIFLFTLVLFIFRNTIEPRTLKKEDFFAIFFPLSFQQYWYITCYAILFVLSPFFNAGLDKLSKKNHLAITIFFFVLTSVIPQTLNVWNYYTNIFLFFGFYFLGSYFKRYPLGDIKFWKWIILILSISLYVGTTLISTFNKQNELIMKVLGYVFLDYGDPIYIACGLGIFVFVISLKPFKCKPLNLISFSSLGVYLISDSIYMRDIIFKFGFPSNQIPYSNYWVLEFLGNNLLRFIIVLAVAFSIKLAYTLTINSQINMLSEFIVKKGRAKEK